MPILMARDTQRALGLGVQACESRSLLQQKLVFFEDIDDYKRVALDLVLTDGQRVLHALREEKKTDQEKAERTGRTDTKRYRDAVAFLETTAPLFDGQRRPVRLGLPSEWTKNIPAVRFRSFELLTAERLVIGLSNGVLENGGLTLHRFFGVPIIPGSALKGISREAAVYVDEAHGWEKTIFGNETKDKEARQGDVSFLDAFPTSPNARLEYEVCTPHYKGYYGMEVDRETRGLVNPDALDDENPVPNLFPVVAKGVRFRFQLLALNSRLSDAQAGRSLDTAVKCLKEALTTRGVGAKTAAGYGWFDEPSASSAGVSADNVAIAKPEPAGPTLDEEQQLVRDLKPLAGNTGNFRALFPKLKGIVDAGRLARVFDAIIPPQELRDFRRQNRYWQSFQSNPDGRAILQRLGRDPK